MEKIIIKIILENNFTMGINRNWITKIIIIIIIIIIINKCIFF